MDDIDRMRRRGGALTLRRATATRVSALGALLRRRRRRAGCTLADMADALSRDLLDLSPEALAALERGDAPPPAGFEAALERRFPSSGEERADLMAALFLADDPFSDVDHPAAIDLTAAEALADLTAPIHPGDDDAHEVAKALLRARRNLSRLADGHRA